MVFDAQYHHPVERVAAFGQFCAENGFECEILSSFDKSKLAQGTFWMILNDVHLVDLLLCAKEEGLKVKSDFGVITYDDTPMKKVVADGVATISVDFYDMGRLVAEQLKNWNPELKITVPTIFTRRSTV